jgi:hypothetical protein
MKTGTRNCDCGRIISGNARTCFGCSTKPAGVLEILNVQGGDVKISFDKANVQETIRAKRIIVDMLRRGYALVVEVERDGEKKYERVQAFDAERGEYIIADLDADVAETVDAEEEVGAPPPAEPEKRRRGRPSTRLSMQGTRATAVGRSAGG